MLQLITRERVPCYYLLSFGTAPAEGPLIVTSYVSRVSALIAAMASLNYLPGSLRARILCLHRLYVCNGRFPGARSDCLVDSRPLRRHRLIGVRSLCGSQRFGELLRCGCRLKTLSQPLA